MTQTKPMSISRPITASDVRDIIGDDFTTGWLYEVPDYDTRLRLSTGVVAKATDRNVTFMDGRTISYTLYSGKNYGEPDIYIPDRGSTIVFLADGYGHNQLGFIRWWIYLSEWGDNDICDLIPSQTRRTKPSWIGDGPEPPFEISRPWRNYTRRSEPTALTVFMDSLPTLPTGPDPEPTDHAEPTDPEPVPPSSHFLLPFKLHSLDPVWAERVAWAAMIAASAHADQRDKSGQPYIFHPMRVAMAGANGPEMVVGFLHDVLEDCNAAYGKLIHLHLMTWGNEGNPSCNGEAIYNALIAITHQPNEPNVDYWERVQSDPVALAVKMNDIRDNWSRLALIPSTSDRERIDMKYQRAVAFFSLKHDVPADLLRVHYDQPDEPEGRQ